MNFGRLYFGTQHYTHDINSYVVNVYMQIVSKSTELKVREC